MPGIDKRGGKPKTVRVRILVAVDRQGKWVCSSAYSGDRDAREWIILDHLDQGEVFHWIEADVSLPPEAGPAIEGKVADG